MANSPIQAHMIYAAFRDRLQVWSTTNSVQVLDPFVKSQDAPGSKYVFMQMMNRQGSPTVDLSVYEVNGFVLFKLGTIKGTSEYNLLKLGDKLADQFPAGLTMPITGATITIMQPPNVSGESEEVDNFLVASIRVQIEVS